MTFDQESPKNTSSSPSTSTPPHTITDYKTMFPFLDDKWNSSSFGFFQSSASSTASSFDEESGRLKMEFSDIQKDSDADRVIEKQTIVECINKSHESLASLRDNSNNSNNKDKDEDDLFIKRLEEIKKNYTCDIITKTYSNTVSDYIKSKHLYADGEEKETDVPFEQVSQKYNIRVPKHGPLESLFVSPIGTEHLRELQDHFEKTTKTLGRMLEDTWRLMDSYSLRDMDPIRKESKDDDKGL